MWTAVPGHEAFWWTWLLRSINLEETKKAEPTCMLEKWPCFLWCGSLWWFQNHLPIGTFVFVVLKQQQSLKHLGVASTPTYAIASLQQVSREAAMQGAHLQMLQQQSYH